MRKTIPGFVCDCRYHSKRICQFDFMSVCEHAHSSGERLCKCLKVCENKTVRRVVLECECERYFAMSK